MKRRDERQGSTNPNWVIYPEADAYQNEQDEISRQQGNNSELLEKLKKMEQGMLERDIQLKA